MDILHRGFVILSKKEEKRKRKFSMRLEYNNLF